MPKNEFEKQANASYYGMKKEKENLLSAEDGLKMSLYFEASSNGVLSSSSSGASSLTVGLIIELIINEIKIEETNKQHIPISSNLRKRMT